MGHKTIGPDFRKRKFTKMAASCRSDNYKLNDCAPMFFPENNEIIFGTKAKWGHFYLRQYSTIPHIRITPDMGYYF